MSACLHEHFLSKYMDTYTEAFSRYVSLIHVQHRNIVTRCLYFQPLFVKKGFLYIFSFVSIPFYHSAKLVLDRNCIFALSIFVMPYTESLPLPACQSKVPYIHNGHLHTANKDPQWHTSSVSHTTPHRVALEALVLHLSHTNDVIYDFLHRDCLPWVLSWFLHAFWDSWTFCWFHNLICDQILRICLQKSKQTVSNFDFDITKTLKFSL